MGKTTTANLDQIMARVRSAAQQAQWMVVEGLLAPVIAKGRPNAEVLYFMAMALEASLKFDEAAVLAKRSFRLQPNPGAALVLARVARVGGDTEQALEFCDRAEQLTPGDRFIGVIRAGAYEEAGRYDEAMEIVEALMKTAEERGEEQNEQVLYEWAKLLVHKKRYDEAIVVIDDLMGRQSTPQQRRQSLLYLRAKACDKSKDFSAAFRAAEAANLIGAVAFDPRLYADQVDALSANWSREAMSTYPLSTCESDVPVFVAGMPRSGTSLIDQIIDAHPQAAGVGELDVIDNFALQLSQAYDSELPAPECFGPFGHDRKWTQAAEKYLREVRKLAPDAKRIVNKSLGNDKLIGFIARLFPNCRIIHAIRDPRDVAISCFMGGFNNSRIAWTTRVEWAAHAWRQSMRLMEHWKQVLDVPILDVHYENLVRSPETEFPRIIEFLGLEWDEACREFHKSRRTVRTLSYDQVNRPVYTSSAGRHANYAELIEGVDFPEYMLPQPA